MAIIVYRNTDRVKLKINEVELIVKPLSYREKLEVSGAFVKEGGAVKENSLMGLYKIIKYSVKGISGVNYMDGIPINLEFEEDDSLKEESIDELLNMEIGKELTMSMYQFINGIPKSINDADGNPLENVQLVPMESLPKKK